MSSELISPSKLLYSRDFLLKYSANTPQKEEPVFQGESKKDNSLKKSSGVGVSGNHNNSNNNINNINNINPYNPSYRVAKTPNPRKTGTLTVYSQKENVPSQTPVKLGTASGSGVSGGVESFYATPLRKALVPRAFRSPVRKTWVAAGNNNPSSTNELSTMSNSSLNASDAIADISVNHHPIVSTQSLPVPELKTMMKDYLNASSSNPNISYSSENETIYPVAPATPSRSNLSAYSEPALYLSPKSTSSTPFKSPASPGRNQFLNSPSKSPARPISPLDEQRLAQRQKQIDYGYRTVGYLRYRLLVTKDQRKAEHPRTPKKTQGCSKRSWDGQLKKWRRDLHLWDPLNTDAFKALLNSDLVVSIVAANPELAEIVDIVREKLENPGLDLDESDEFSFENLNLSSPQPPSTMPPSSRHFPVFEMKPTPTPTPSKEDGNNKVPTKVARTLVF